MGLFSKAEESVAGAFPSEKAQQLAQTNGAVQQKHGRGGARPGAGRKPGSGNVAPAQPGTQVESEIVASPADIEFCKTIAETILRIVDRVEINAISKVIVSIGDPILLEKTPEFLKEREITADDYELIRNTAGALAVKYASLTKYAPEMALVGWAATHGMAFSNVLKTLREYALVVKKEKMKGVVAQDFPVMPHASSPPTL